MNSAREQFEAIIAAVAELAPGWPVRVDTGRRFARLDGPRNVKVSPGWGRLEQLTRWVAEIRLADDGVDMDTHCLGMGSIAHSGGRVALDEDPRQTALAMLRAARVPVARA